MGDIIAGHCELPKEAKFATSPPKANFGTFGASKLPPDRQLRGVPTDCVELSDESEPLCFIAIVCKQVAGVVQVVAEIAVLLR
jgi:hypothetical protein